MKNIHLTHQERMKNNENLSDIETKLRNVIKHVNFVDFAILFGSHAINKSNNMSDVDIGIFTTRDIPLLEIGKLTARIESIMNRKVDIIVINALYRERPLFAYEIISKGKVIFSGNNANLIEFRRKAFLYYLDVKHLIDNVNKGFKERLLKNKFGERTYA